MTFMDQATWLPEGKQLPTVYFFIYSSAANLLSFTRMSHYTQKNGVYVYKLAKRPTFAVWNSIKQAEDKQGMVIIVAAVEGTVHHV